MTKEVSEDPLKQSILLTILFTILSCLIWTIIIVFIFNIPLRNWMQGKIIPFPNQLLPTQISEDDTSRIETQTANFPLNIAETLIAEPEGILKKIALETIQQYNYPLFLYPVSQNMRLPMDFPTTESQLPLVGVGDVSVAEMVVNPLNDLMNAARNAGFSPYLRSGFRSIDDQYTAFSKYVTEATAAGKSLTEAREYANRFSAIPGYSEHHLGLAVDLLDYSYRDWIVARNNYDKGLYLWLRQHAQEFGFVISYPTGTETLLAKAGSGYALSEPWHLRFVGNDLAVWLYNNGYLDPQAEITVNAILLSIDDFLESSQ